MERVEAYHILAAMWDDATPKQREALDIATRDVEFVDLMPGYYEPVKHGRWISLTECSNAGVYCSVCTKKVYKEDYAWCNKKNKVRSNYCPNCGAKMDLEVKNET